MVFVEATSPVNRPVGPLARRGDRRGDPDRHPALGVRALREGVDVVGDEQRVPAEESASAVSTARNSASTAPVPLRGRLPVAAAGGMTTAARLVDVGARRHRPALEADGAAARCRSCRAPGVAGVGLPGHGGAPVAAGASVAALPVRRREVALVAAPQLRARTSRSRTRASPRAPARTPR